MSNEGLHDSETAFEPALPPELKYVEEEIVGWLLDNAPVALMIFDSSGRCRFARGNGLSLAGFAPDNLKGRTLQEIFPDEPALPNVIEQCREGETSCVSLKVGERFYDSCCAPIQHGAERWVAIVSTDVTSSVQAEEALEAEEELLRSTIEAVREAVIATDAAAKITLFNRAAEELTGWRFAEASGKQIEEVVRFRRQISEAGPPASGLALSSMEQEIEIDAGPGILLQRKDGSTVEVAAHYAPIKTKGGRVVGAVLTLRDLSEERKRDEERIRLEKLESLALMASGLSHDFNNMLTAILANLALAREQTERERILEFVGEAEHAAVQARELTNKLASFARPTPPRLEPISLLDVVDRALTLALVGREVSKALHLPADLWPVLGDESQLVQVFSNLFLNAAQSMPGGGCITVRAENIVLTEGEPKAGARLAPGRYVKVIVEDQGEGIPPENLQKVFDPYFTTKPAGTGLGLPTAFSIVRKHGGYMTLSSEVGKGTVVIVYLPAADVAASVTTQGAATAESTLPAGASVAGEAESAPTGDSERRRVLVVDDEAGVRKVVARALEDVGWEVDAAEDPVKAIERFREALEKSRPYDVVLLDLTMPGGIGGEMTLDELAKLDPSVKAIALTGRTDSNDISALVRRGFISVLQKPFDVAALRSVVEQTADSRRARKS
jgi:PAS domain S-box-containing protein